MFGQSSIGFDVGIVQYQVDEIESREEGGWKLDVFDDGEARIVAGFDRVGAGEDGGTGVEGGDDAGLGYGYCLLLHGLVQNRPRGVAHLIELVDAANAQIAQYQSSALQYQIARLGISNDARRETDRRRSFPGGVHTPWTELVNVPQQLGLGRAWISAKEDVNVSPLGQFGVFPSATRLLLLLGVVVFLVLLGKVTPPGPSASSAPFLGPSLHPPAVPAEQHAQYSALHVVQFPDGGSQRLDQLIVNVRLTGQLLQLGDARGR
mmetsp:Transcript_2567/g.6686  ORF Transcript_2567/g.6686 Transcript_2567/m.6686 type:complete len:263 (-) Transcript_2567:128-916(-)